MRWIEWVEPGPDGDPVYMRVDEYTAIKQMYATAAQMGKPDAYTSDEEALLDFIVVMWATIKEDYES